MKGRGRRYGVRLFLSALFSAYSSSPPYSGPMVKRLIPSVLIAALLLTAAPGDFAGVALAQGCLSSGDARDAVKAGQAQPLSRMLKTIRNATGGEILPPPQLCNEGGRLVYYVNVMAPNGQVSRVVVDAASGSILGY